MVVTSDLEAPGWLLYEVVLLLSDWGGGGGGGGGGRRRPSRLWL